MVKRLGFRGTLPVKYKIDFWNNPITASILVWNQVVLNQSQQLGYLNSKLMLSWDCPFNGTAAPIHIKIRTVFTCIVYNKLNKLTVFVSNPSTLAHICQSIRYNLVSVLLLSCFVKVRYLSYGFKSTLCPKSNPIPTIFTNCAPFHSISTPYPFPYGFPLHWRALIKRS